MTEVSRHMDVASDRIWDVLADGWLYTGWVVGAAHVRAVEPQWPAVGAKLHHAVGGWPVQIKDHTRVVESEPGRRLVLQARGWPAGEARVTITLEPDAAATTVRIDEAPNAGPGKWLDNPLQRRILVARNRESLSRLESLASRRTSA